MEEIFQIQCFTCGNWFCNEDVTISLEGYIPYMTNYEYCCVSCGTESIVKRPASFIQVGITVLANLTADSADNGDGGYRFFSLEKEIIPFVWDHWDNICTKRSKTGNWRNNLATKLSTETRIFCESEEGSDEFGLVDQDLSAISPRRYESKTVPAKGMGKMKRKTVDSNPVTSAPKRTRGEREVSSRALSHGYPLEHPYNKDGYRYILAEKDTHASVDMDPEEMAGRAIPPELYRPYMPTEVLLALHDRAPQLKVAENRLTVTGEKGYCMIRATHGVSYGSWYYEVSKQYCEVHIDDLDTVKESTTRMGWSQSLGNLQAPCGYDKLSYSCSSKFGTRFHQSHGKHYSTGYSTGDTMGFLIVLPPRQKSRLNLPPTHKDKVLIKFKNFFYFEEKDEAVEEFEKTLKPLPGSKVIFYKNGVSQGVAWTDIYAGRYYPALSFYKPAMVTANMGPDFKYPPRDVKYRPMSEAAEVNAVEQTMSEVLFHVDSNITREYPPL